VEKTLKKTEKQHVIGEAFRERKAMEAGKKNRIAIFQTYLWCGEGI